MTDMSGLEIAIYLAAPFIITIGIGNLLERYFPFPYQADKLRKYLQESTRKENKAQ